MELGPKITVHLIDCCKEVAVSGLATRLLASGPMRKEKARILYAHVSGLATRLLASGPKRKEKERILYAHVSGLATRLLASGPKRKETEREYCMLISHTAGERG